MARLIMWNLMSLDGFIAGPGGNLDWHNDVWGPEMAALSETQGDAMSGMIFGRKTYDLMAGYWPTATEEEQIKHYMNTMPKWVFSNSLTSLVWQNCTLLKGDAAAEVRKLKAQQEKDLFVFGSADLSEQLLPAGVFDELRIAIGPLLLGDGVRLFRKLPEKRGFKLLKHTPMASGGMILYYQPV